MARKTLNDILTEEDELGLLANLKPVTSAAGSQHQRARQKLEDINTFIDRNNRMPGDVPAEQKISPSEKMLQFALNGLRTDSEIAAALRPFDRHELLGSAEPIPAPPSSLDEIIESDDELLTTSADDIFTFGHTPSPKAKPDRKAERKTCPDFSKFKPIFDACAADLQSGRRKTMEFRKEQEIQTGEFFILNGAMIYVAEKNEPHIRGGKANARLRLIFDNGTEGDNLLRSLAAELYKDGPAGRGRRVTAAQAGPLFKPRPDNRSSLPQINDPLTKHGPGFSESQNGLAGQIYVVRSLSPDPEIRKLEGYLFKIGFTTGNVETRVIAAKDDPTFLLAPVHPVKTYTVYNLNTVKMENLLHRFFGDARLDIEIKDRFGKPCRPREWFLVPLEIVDEAVKKLIDGSIVHYQYDRSSGRIIHID